MSKNLILIFGIFAVWLIMIRGLSNVGLTGSKSEGTATENKETNNDLETSGSALKEELSNVVDNASEAVNTEITPMTTVLNGLEKQYTL